MSPEQQRAALEALLREAMCKAFHRITGAWPFAEDGAWIVADAHEYAARHCATAPQAAAPSLPATQPKPITEHGLPRAIERLKAQIQWLRHGTIAPGGLMMAVDDMETLLAALPAGADKP